MPEERNVTQKEAGNKIKYKDFLYTGTTNLKPELYECACTNWSNGKSKEILKKLLEAKPGKRSR